MKREKKPFFRYCKNPDCEKKFHPHTKYQDFCEECKEKLQNEAHRRRTLKWK
jgi:hypothetical protein